MSPSAILAVAASTRAAARWAPHAFDLLAVYGALAAIGWFVDVLALQTAFRVPLQPADNVFYLLLATAALMTIVVAQRARRQVRR